MVKVVWRPYDLNTLVSFFVLRPILFHGSQIKDFVPELEGSVLLLLNAESE